MPKVLYFCLLANPRFDSFAAKLHLSISEDIEDETFTEFVAIRDAVGRFVVMSLKSTLIIG